MTSPQKVGPPVLPSPAGRPSFSDTACGGAPGGYGARMSRPYPPDPNQQPGWQQRPHQPQGQQYPPQYAPQGQQYQRPQRPAPEPPPRDEGGGGVGGGIARFGLGLVLSVLGLVVQVVSLFLLPWLSAPGGIDQSLSLPDIWDIAREFGAEGFSGNYLFLFSYPLAAIAFLLSLVAVLESVAMKVVWALLTLIGLGVLVLRFGLWPAAEVLISDEPLNLSNKEITISIIALVALVAVIFMLKTAMSMFRRIAGVILLLLGGLHVWALNDFTSDLSDLSIGAWGPAAGFVLAAAAAFVGPRKLA